MTSVWVLFWSKFLVLVCYVISLQSKRRRAETSHFMNVAKADLGFYIVAHMMITGRGCCSILARFELT